MYFKGSVRLLRVEVPLERLETYGFTDNGHGIWEYRINDRFSIIVNKVTLTKESFTYSTDNVVRLYYYGEIVDEFGYVEDLVNMPEVIYLLIKDKVISPC